MPPLLAIQNLQTHFFTPTGLIKAINGVDLHIGTGETLALVGESGCGKSLTALSLLRLVPEPGRIVGGEIRFEGRDLLRMPLEEMRRVRGNRIGMVFQEPMTSLNPVLRVGEQVAEVLRLHQGLDRVQADAEVAHLFGQVGIPAPLDRARDYPHQLSGGMRQRVMIAIAIATQPKLLLADEPTTALDVTIQDQILNLLASLRKETGMAMILVSHDVGVVAQNCDLVAVMYAGRIMEFGLASDVMQAPRHPYTRGLLSAVPILEREGTRRPLTSIPGQPPNLADLPPGCPFQPRCSFVNEQCASIPVELDRNFPGHGSACPFVD